MRSDITANRRRVAEPAGGLTGRPTYPLHKTRTLGCGAATVVYL
jgi:hypothetical protein